MSYGHKSRSIYIYSVLQPPGSSKSSLFDRMLPRHKRPTSLGKSGGELCWRREMVSATKPVLVITLHKGSGCANASGDRVRVASGGGREPLSLKAQGLRKSNETLSPCCLSSSCFADSRILWRPMSCQSRKTPAAAGSSRPGWEIGKMHHARGWCRPLKSLTQYRGTLTKLRLSSISN